jgi:iron complex outermembrane receptor protein
MVAQKVAGCALLFSLVASPAVLAQEIESMTVTGQLSRFGATKSNVPIVETARSISIETAEQFKEKGALNLSQATSYMSGVTAETYGFSTRGDWIHARGLELPRYRDSIQELFGSYNTTRAELYTIEQVEVLKGPASVLYGQGSPGGIVNYVSKTPKAESDSEVVVEIGNHNRKQVGLDSTGQIGSSDWLYRVVALGRDSDTQVEHVNDDVTLFMPSISYVPSDDTSYTLLAMYQDSNADTAAQFIPIEGTLNPLAGGGYIDQDVYAGEPGWNKFDTESSQLTALVEHRFNANLGLEATALWRDGEADYNQAWPLFTGAGASRYLNQALVDAGMIPAGTPTGYSDTVVPRSFYQGDNTFEQLALDVRLTAEFSTGTLNHEVLFGGQYQDVETDSDTAYFYGAGVFSGDFTYALDLADPVYTGSPDQSVFDAILNDGAVQNVKDLGLYLSDQISVGNWRLTAGLRYDDVDNDDGTTRQTDSELSTSLGLLYRFESGVSSYVSYSESFETVVGTDLSGNQLEPEEGKQYEVGLKYEPDSIPALITLSYYDIEISNLPNPNSLPGDAAQQQGVSELDGIEFEAQAMLGDYYLRMGLSTLDARDQNNYEFAAEPDSNASIWVTWNPSTTPFRAGGGIRYVGESVSEDATVRYVTPDYTLADLMFGYQLNDNWDLALNFRNLTDEKYLTSCLTRGDCFPGMRRTAVATMTYDF